MVGEHGWDVQRPGITKSQPAADEGVLDVHNVHRLEELPGGMAVSRGDVIARVEEGQAGRANDARLVVLVVRVAEGEDEYIVPKLLQVALVQLHVMCYAANVRLVYVCHHADAHEQIVQAREEDV